MRQPVCASCGAEVGWDMDTCPWCDELRTEGGGEGPWLEAVSRYFVAMTGMGMVVVGVVLDKGPALVVGGILVAMSIVATSGRSDG